MTEKLVERYANNDEVAKAAAARLINAIQTAMTDRGRADVVLTGGGIGTELLRYTARNNPKIDWRGVHFYWGDERYLAHDDPDRNSVQAHEALLDHIDVPAANVHAMPASDDEFGDDIDAAALAYEQVLAANAITGPTPIFDVHLLGMGSEGHINSLFPKSAAVKNDHNMVVAVTNSPKPPPERITLTLPAVRRSREVWFVVGGTSNARAVAAAVGGANEYEVPAAGAIGTQKTVWLLDVQAAALIA